MSKAIAYIKLGQVGKVLAVYTNAVDATVDTAATNLASNGGVMPDGTLVSFAQKYDPAYFDAAGNLLGGTVTLTYGSQPTGIAADIHVRDYGTPILASTTALKAATALTAAVQLGVVPTAQPDSLRTLTFTGNAAGIAGNVVVKGTSSGVATTENVALAGAATVETVNAYDPGSVTYDLPIQTHAGTDTVAAGVGSQFGIGVAGSVNPIIKVNHGTTVAVALSAVTLDAATASKNLFTQSGVLDGAKRLRAFLVY